MLKDPMWWKKGVLPSVFKDFLLSLSPEFHCSNFHCPSLLIHDIEWYLLPLTFPGNTEPFHTFYQSHSVCYLPHLPLSMQNYPHQHHNYLSPAIQPVWLVSIILQPVSVSVRQCQSQTVWAEWYGKHISKFSLCVGRCVRSTCGRRGAKKIYTGVSFESKWKQPSGAPHSLHQLHSSQLFDKFQINA